MAAMRCSQARALFGSAQTLTVWTPKAFRKCHNGGGQRLLEAAVECCTELTTFEGYLSPCGTIVNA